MQTLCARDSYYTRSADIIAYISRSSYVFSRHGHLVSLISNHIRQLSISKLFVFFDISVDFWLHNGLGRSVHRQRFQFRALFFFVLFHASRDSLNLKLAEKVFGLFIEMHVCEWARSSLHHSTRPKKAAAVSAANKEDYFYLFFTSRRYRGVEYVLCRCNEIIPQV